MECYKDVLESLWCYDNWFGKYAKIIQHCEFSAPQLVQLYQYDVKRGINNPNYWLNSEDSADATACIPGLLWKSENPDSLPNVMQNRFWHWFEGTMKGMGKTISG